MTASDLIKRLREVFDDPRVSVKNIAIRKAANVLEAQTKRIAELEAALLVRLDRKVLNDTWRNRAEKAETAVKMLVEALKEAWCEGYHDGIGDGHPLSSGSHPLSSGSHPLSSGSHPLSSGSHQWKNSEAVEALDDPIVKSILEGVQ